ncbi:MAG: double zinc ribbon domain-containing protein [Planctomycetes bacterium]|nr:double zinc ribbon domain-containing protein [Planctomycetota bacterium]
MSTSFLGWRSFRRPARELLRAALDLVLPPACPACGQLANALCRRCDQLLQRRPAVGCRRCGEAVAPGAETCLDDHRALQNLRFHAAPWRFAGTGGALVRTFKLDGDAAAGRLLARAMALALRRHGLGPKWRRAILVPVPLHAARRRERGFDQAAWLAAAIGQRLALPVEPTVLVRVRATLPQGDPRVLSRAGNVDGAFAVAQPNRIAGRRVILVDDVLTSGATLRQCAALLRAAGATGVGAVTACRS